MMDFDYTVKVYSDAVELGRSFETIPGEYKKAVEYELNRRKDSRTTLADKMKSAHENAHEK